MNNIKNQTGIATLEIILVTAIIAVFATVAVPKMARIVDKVNLNYEMKHLVSELYFARSIGKSSAYKPSIFVNDVDKQSGEVEFWIHDNNESDDDKRNRYELKRTAQTNDRFYEHYSINGITLQNSPTHILKIGFDNNVRFYNASNESNTNSMTITLISEQNQKAYVVIDSVGRFHGAYVK